MYPNRRRPFETRGRHAPSPSTGIIASAAVTALCVKLGIAHSHPSRPVVGGLLKGTCHQRSSDLPYEKFVTDTNKGGELPDKGLPSVPPDDRR
jgi:hypothetical protein